MSYLLFRYTLITLRSPVGARQLTLRQGFKDEVLKILPYFKREKSKKICASLQTDNSIK